MAEMRSAMIKLREQGLLIRKISELLDVPVMTISDHIKRYEETGRHENKPKGRPEKKLSKSEEHPACEGNDQAQSKTVESLKRALIKAWDEISVETLAKIVDDFPKRLKACVEAEGGHFE
uniref:Transposase n=1 Tax=Acrobeloides nanus TaxID=290746 RepID=A0A914CZ08_9BILA